MSLILVLVASMLMLGSPTSAATDGDSLSVAPVYSLDALLVALSEPAASELPMLGPRKEVIRQVRELGLEHRELLEGLIGDERLPVARAAAEALGRIGDERALARIRAELEGLEGASDRRYYFAAALAEAGDTTALAALKALQEAGHGFEFAIARAIERLECPGSVQPLIAWEDGALTPRFLIDDVEDISFDGGLSRKSVVFESSEYGEILHLLLSGVRQCVSRRGSVAGGLHIRLGSGREAVFCRGDSLFYYCPRQYSDEWAGVALRSRPLAQYIDDAIGESSN